MILIGEMYELDNHLYTVVSRTQITDFRDGNPFTYPAILIESVDGRTRVIPEFQLDRLAKYTPSVDLVDINEFETFAKYFDLATKGQYTAHISSFKSDTYREYYKSLDMIVSNFNNFYSNNNLSDKSKELLKAFAMMLLVTIEMNSVKKKENPVV